MAKDYSASLNLPNTTFAMRAELPKREKMMLLLPIAFAAMLVLLLI